MNNKRLFLDIHAIQSVPPSNLNRDDTGSPKTAQYGGVRRARVSSQSWKRAIRTYFLDNSDEANVGVRTKEIVQYVAKKIMQQDNTISLEEALKIADKVFNDAGVKTKDLRAKALFFLGNKQAEKLAQIAIAGNYKKDDVQNIIKADQAIDIALFGRMVADDPSLNEDASSQVAHAISTHAIQSEFDFFTAVDDLSPEDNAGAGMLGTIEYNSSTLYRYANIAVHELSHQLNNKEAVKNTLKLFVESFSNSMPTGKVNTFANQTFPHFIAITLREDRPINLVSAFEEPIKSNDGYARKSIQRLAEEFKKAEKFVEKPLLTLYVTMKKTDDITFIGEEKDSLKELLHELASAIETYVE